MHSKRGKIVSQRIPKVRPRIGLLPTGHKIDWRRYPTLRERGLEMYEKLVARLADFGEVISPTFSIYENAPVG